MRFLKKAALFLVVAGLIGGGTWAAAWYLHERWYVFAETEANEPQAKVVIDRDYAYRTGDLIPVSIRLKHKPGVNIDSGAFALNGDFEIAETKPLVRKEMEDGSVCYKQDLVLQSFSLEWRLKATAEISWWLKDAEAVQELKVEIGPFSRSHTWDGREELQEGNNKKLPPWTHLSKSCGMLLGSALIVAYLGLLTWRLYWEIWTYRNPGLAMLRKLDAVLAKINGGDLNRENYRAVDAMIRSFFGVEAVLPSQIASNTLTCADELRECLELGQTALYSTSTLTGEQNSRLAVLARKLCKTAFEPPAKKRN